MGKNAYFQLVHGINKTMLKVFPASKDGEMFSVDEVKKYLELINFGDVDIATLNAYLTKADYHTEYILDNKESLPENERCIIRIEPDGTRAVGRFYPPSTKGKKLTRDDVLSDLKFAGVVHGIRQDVVDEFMKNPEYCRDYVLAVATPPVQGHDAHIEYHFDINTTAKPKLNEDGSVDFHQLGNIKPVKPGDKLATLTPADHGKPGINVVGAPLPPNKVSVQILRFGRNITISEDKCTIYSQVAGHVTLVDDLVMVSDVYEVPANVDASTGDIEYKGTVNIVGNVNTGYAVKADGDIVVNGVVEGATLIAGGNIVLKRGMQGMSRGSLEAGGNITAKFIENSRVVSGGTLMCDAVLHSDVECKGEISILGKKGLINGGHVRSFTNIAATQIGSPMGTSTVVEIMSDVEQSKTKLECEEKIKQTKDALAKMDKVLLSIKRAIKSGKQISNEQARYLKLASLSKPKLIIEIENLELQIESLNKLLSAADNVNIRIEGVVNAGSKIVIKDVSRIYKDRIMRCKFVRDGAEIKSLTI